MKPQQEHFLGSVLRAFFCPASPPESAAAHSSAGISLPSSESSPNCLSKADRIFSEVAWAIKRKKNNQAYSAPCFFSPIKGSIGNKCHSAFQQMNGPVVKNTPVFSGRNIFYSNSFSSGNSIFQRSGEDTLVRVNLFKPVWRLGQKISSTLGVGFQNQGTGPFVHGSLSVLPTQSPSSTTSLSLHWPPWD